MQAKGAHIKNSFPWIAVFSIAAFIAAICHIELAEDAEVLPSFLSESNITKYLFALCIFAVSFFLAYGAAFLLRRRNTSASLLERPLSKTAGKLLFAFLLLLVSGLLLHRRFVSELNDYGVTINKLTLHAFPQQLSLILLILAGTLICLYSRTRKDIPQAFVFAGYILIAAAAFAADLVLNVFNANAHHAVAYTESILNVYYGVPYTLETTGIYGHYALFYAPLLRLLGGSPTVLHCMMSAAQSAVVLICACCIHNIVKENWLRLLAVLACCVSTMAMRTNNYWQLHPHRILFPLILLIYVLHLIKKDRWRFRDLLGGYGLCTLAVLWNTESGLFCGVAFAACFIIHDLQSHSWYCRKMLTGYVCHIAFVLGSLLSAIGIMNLYNFLCGHTTPELSVFFFPLGSSDYMNVLLKYDITVENDAWVYVLALFGLLLLFSLYYTSFFLSKEEVSAKPASRYAPALAAVAVLGLLNFSYYANRAAYFNLDITLQLACVGMCLLWRMFSNIWTHSDRETYTAKQISGSVLSVISIVVITSLALQTVLFTGSHIQTKYERGHYDTSSLQAACEEIQANIPEDTFAFGTGISLLYQELGWDIGGRYRDISDLSVGGNAVLEKIAADAVTHDSFLVFNTSHREEKILARILELDPTYQLTTEIEVNGGTLLYYVRLT